MKKRILAAILFFVCLCAVFAPGRAFAASTSEAKEPIDPNAACTLTVEHRAGDVRFPDIPVRIYRVADVSSDFQYTLTEAFAETLLQLNGISSQAEWNTVRSTLDMFIAANDPEPCAEAATDSDGIARFGELKPGLYYISQVICSKDGFRYYFAPALTALPNLEPDGTWNYDVRIKSKADMENPTGEDLEYKVLKVWKDDGRAKRPTSVTVDILHNGDTVKTVTLSEENNWSFSWFAEDDGSVWSVIERNVPEGYVMTVEERTTTFVIVNTYPDKPEEPEPETGETANIGLYITVMCISGIMLLALSAIAKRDRECA